MILHIPHSGTNILDRKVKPEDLINYTDWFTDELFSHQNTDRIVQKHSRLIVDCERLPDEIEPLYKEGFGICYEKDFDGNDIDVPDKEAMLEIYRQHHVKLNKLTRKTLCYIPVVFVIDCHSFGDMQIKSDIDVCLGFNDDFNEFDMLDEIKTLLEQNGYKVGINTPYSNAIVPNQLYGNEAVKSIMIEVNKRLYLKNGNEKSENFDKTRDVMTQVLDIISTHEERYNDF